MLDSNIDTFRERINLFNPSNTHCSRVLDQELINIIRGIENDFPLLREYANGQVPFIIDLLPGHLMRYGAPEEAYRQFNFVMERFRRRYHEYCHLKIALIEAGPRARILPYRVIEEWDPETGYWQDELPTINPHFGTVGGPAILDPYVEAWALVESNPIQGVPPHMTKSVRKWMKRDDMVWIANGGDRRLIFTDVDGNLRCYDQGGNIARLGIKFGDWAMQMEDEEAEAEQDNEPDVGAARDEPKNEVSVDDDGSPIVTQTKRKPRKKRGVKIDTL